jgi:transcriptional regulator with XRE-family HTH domain
MTTSDGTKNQVAETPRDTSSETEGAAFHGHWLRARRQQKGVRTADVASQIGGPPADINTVERNNLRLPLVWIPSLLKLKLLTVAEAKAAMQMPSEKSSRMNGKWIRDQRLQRKLKPADVASKLGTSRLDVELIETRNWLIPTEWLLPLSELFASTTSGKGKAPSQKAKTKEKGTATPKEEAKSATKAPVQTESKPATVKPATVKPATVKPATVKPSKVMPIPQPVATQSQGELTDAVVRYRLMIGERAGLSAVEVLAQIAADLQLTLGKDALSYERLRAAMQALTRA